MFIYLFGRVGSAPEGAAQWTQAVLQDSASREYNKPRGFYRTRVQSSFRAWIHKVHKLRAAKLLLLLNRRDIHSGETHLLRQPVHVVGSKWSIIPSWALWVKLVRFQIVHLHRTWPVTCFNVCCQMIWASRHVLDMIESNFLFKNKRQFSEYTL